MELTVFASERETDRDWLQRTPPSIIVKPPKNENGVPVFFYF